MSRPLKFSIITCTRNSVATLAQTIDSVQQQDHPHVDHIFVDGGSTDGTLDMIAERCPGATVLTDVDGGISAAMNAGIDVATGDIIAHLHSDDYYVDGSVLAHVAERFNLEPTRQWAYGRIHVLLNGKIHPLKGPMRPFTFQRYAAGRASVPHPAVFVRRDAFAAIGRFDTSLNYAMDIDFWLRLGRHDEPIQIDAPLTVFRGARRQSFDPKQDRSAQGRVARAPALLHRGAPGDRGFRRVAFAPDATVASRAGGRLTVMSSNGAPKVTVLVKALNEEARIAACLEAAVREVATVDGEVILVDSLSTDRTLAIAKTFPVHIVQFVNRADLGCAAAVQLGYQYARGEFVYVLDGDMVLEPGFLGLAVSLLERMPDVAGVAGTLREDQVLTMYDVQRASRSAAIHSLSEVPDLGGGGLYRRAAVEQVEYLAHRGLAAFEEAELGARLRAAGWRLLRMPQVGSTHRGHTETNMQMLRRLWRNRRAHAYGQLLRSAIGNRWWWRVCLKLRHILATLCIHGLAVAVTLAAMARGYDGLPTLILVELMLWLAVFTMQLLHKRSARWSAFSLLSWHYFTAAAVIGMFARIPDPRVPIPGRLVH